MPEECKSKQRFSPWLLILIIATAVLVWIRVAIDETRPSTVATAKPLAESNVESSPQTSESPGMSPVKKATSTDKKSPPANLPPPNAALLTRLKEFHARLLTGISRDEVLAALKQLKQHVHDLSPETAAATLIALLQSGENAPTGLAFVVGDEGVLAESPTYRVALLDFLGQTDPDATIAYSRTLLAETAQPDEYALGLRNLAWLNHEGRLNGEIGTYFAAMLDRDEWCAHPSAGYLEAFDIAASVGGANMIAELASVLRLTAPNGEVIQSAANRAAFIALDRIMLREPNTIAGIYTADSTFLDFAPNHRASLLARLDPNSPQQGEALRAYLRSTPANSQELSYFASLFPNGNFF
jgi:hypothetical protein